VLKPAAIDKFLYSELSNNCEIYAYR